MRSIFLLGLALLLAGCSGSSAAANNQEPQPFFPLEAFIDGEIERLSAAQPEVSKTITVNGQSEEQTTQDINFQYDLAPFRNADINRPAWIEKYRTEATGQDTAYVALDSNLLIQRLAVLRREDGTVRQIEISRRTGNVLSDGQQEMRYSPTAGYTIVSQQKSGVVGDADVKIEVAF